MRDGPANIASQRVPRYTSYPTAPHFRAGIGATTYRRWLAEIPANAALSLYLHIPFAIHSPGFAAAIRRLFTATIRWRATSRCLVKKST